MGTWLIASLVVFLIGVVVLLLLELISRYRK
jgi:hypothetical protein